MKQLLLSISILLSVATASALESGYYECVAGNEPSICPQKIQALTIKKEMTGLRVYYSGYCNDQGPYTYDCEDGTCGDGAIEYSKMRKDSFHWKNIPNGIECDFVKSEKEPEFP